MKQPWGEYYFQNCLRINKIATVRYGLDNLRDIYKYEGTHQEEYGRQIDSQLSRFVPGFLKYYESKTRDEKLTLVKDIKKDLHMFLLFLSQQEPLKKVKNKKEQ